VRFVIRTLTIRGAPRVVLALSLFATAVVCQQAWQFQKDAREVRFRADATILRNTMIERLHQYAQVLQGVRGLFAASETVEEAEFRAYVGSLDPGASYPGIRALGYIEKLDHGQRDDYLRQLSRDPDPAITRSGIWPPGDRADYLVVRFVEPLESNRAALGFDVGSEAGRRKAAVAAGDSGIPVLSAKIELVQAAGKPGAILFHPVYADGAEPDSIDGRRALLKGWVYAAFVIGDMMTGVRKLTGSPLEYEIYDGSTPFAENLLCSSSGKVRPPPPHGLMEENPLTMFGQPWTLRIHSAAGIADAPGILPLGILATGGLCISLLIAGIARSMATTSSRACTLAAGMTQELLDQKEALRAGEERLAMVIKGSNDGIWDWNIITNEVYFSPRWKAMLGYDDDEIENRFAAWQALIHPDDLDRASQMVNDYFAGKIPSYQLEHRLRHKDGSYRWILARGVAARDDQGRPLRMAGSHVDLTDLKQAEHELRRANRELQSSQTRLQATLADLSASHEQLEKTQLELIQAAKLESVGTLAAGVAHEVKNPLQIILMGLDHLDHVVPKGGPKGDETRLTLSDMRDAALRADSITRELLNFSSATEFSPSPADLETVLDRSLWLLRTDLIRSGVTLLKDLAGDLPPVAIDTPKIQQVLINLISNALQAMDRGGSLVITTTCGRLDRLLPDCRKSHGPLRPDEPAVILTIKDSGPGIPEEQLLRIFDPFFTTKAVGSGTGLGLSVVKKIVDLHGGFIHFRNSPRGGLEVTLAFAALPKVTSAASAGPVLVAT
jgi:PAS domain S-box-containing protein